MIMVIGKLENWKIGFEGNQVSSFSDVIIKNQKVLIYVNHQCGKMTQKLQM